MPDDNTSTASVVATPVAKNSSTDDTNRHGFGFLNVCGYILVIGSLACFGTIAYIQYANRDSNFSGKTGLDYLYQQIPSIFLLLTGFIMAKIGKEMMTSARITDSRTIPIEDLDLIRDAVKKGDPNPIDQYLRLRSLSGFAGNFTKLQVTGLPLTTVFLTLVFAGVSLIPTGNADSSKQFLDLAKLTLGAFIGSFVQGRVEQRRQERAEKTGKPSSSLPPA